MIELTTYCQLDAYIQAFAEGHLNLLWLVGPPGVQKSRGLRQALAGTSSHWINGSVTAFGLYRELYENNRPLTVIDDVDDLCRSTDSVNLLKSLCQTEDSKRLGWHTDNATLRREKISRTFVTQTHVCVISNELTAGNANVAALRDRGHLVQFTPSAAEVHKRTAEWFYDPAIFTFIGGRLSWIEQPSMRDYVLAYELKQSGIDWRSWLFTRWGLSGKRLLVAQLQADDQLKQADRLRIYSERTGEDQLSYEEEAFELGYVRREAS